LLKKEREREREKEKELERERERKREARDLLPFVLCVKPIHTRIFWKPQQLKKKRRIKNAAPPFKF
jgi:hypothetical protein